LRRRLRRGFVALSLGDTALEMGVQARSEGQRVRRMATPGLGVFGEVARGSKFPSRVLGSFPSDRSISIRFSSVSALQRQASRSYQPLNTYPSRFRQSATQRFSPKFSRYDRPDTKKGCISYSSPTPVGLLPTAQVTGHSTDGQIPIDPCPRNGLSRPQQPPLSTQYTLAFLYHPLLLRPGPVNIRGRMMNAGHADCTIFL
jgi:hypothetical protein